PALLGRERDEVLLLTDEDVGDLVAFRGPREAATGARRDLAKRVRVEPEHEPAPRHGEEDEVLRARDARIERERSDDALAVAEPEELLDRLAVPRGRRHVVQSEDVRRAVVREEDAELLRRALHHGEDLVALTHARSLRVLELADALEPPVGRHDP